MFTIVYNNNQQEGNTPKKMEVHKLKSYREVILSNGKDTVVLREAMNEKGYLVIVSVVNGCKRVHHCTTLDTELDAYTFTNMKVVDQMSYVLTN